MILLTPTAHNNLFPFHFDLLYLHVLTFVACVLFIELIIVVFIFCKNLVLLKCNLNLQGEKSLKDKEAFLGHYFS